MIFKSTDEIILDNVFVKLAGFIGKSTPHLKIESYNPGGSIKMKTAIALIDDAEKKTDLKKNRRMIESSSGNLGVAISLICAARGYKFTCVVDKNTLPVNLKLIKIYGAEVVVVEKLDRNGGYLGTRLEYIKEKLKSDPGMVWLNQYQNHANPAVHAERTAHAILVEFPRLDFLFIGAGTTGTLAGCVNKFRSASPSTKIVAVDSIGSVNFGGPPSKRHIPGLGSSVSPYFLSHQGIADFIHVAEAETVEVCNRMAREYGLLVGGSTGTVLAALKNYERHIPKNSSIVAISPDNGDRYVETLYCSNWINDRFAKPELDCIESSSPRSHELI